jgi:hypothetical protein
VQEQSAAHGGSPAAESATEIRVSTEEVVAADVAVADVAAADVALTPVSGSSRAGALGSRAARAGSKTPLLLSDTPGVASTYIIPDDVKSSCTTCIIFLRTRIAKQVWQ